jgi:hypothetical protein
VWAVAYHALLLLQTIFMVTSNSSPMIRSDYKGYTALRLLSRALHLHTTHCACSAPLGQTSGLCWQWWTGSWQHAGVLTQHVRQQQPRRHQESQQLDSRGLAIRSSSSRRWVACLYMTLYTTVLTVGFEMLP